MVGRVFASWLIVLLATHLSAFPTQSLGPSQPASDEISCFFSPSSILVAILFLAILLVITFFIVRKLKDPGETTITLEALRDLIRSMEKNDDSEENEESKRIAKEIRADAKIKYESIPDKEKADMLITLFRQPGNSEILSEFWTMRNAIQLHLRDVLSYKRGKANKTVLASWSEEKMKEFILEQVHIMVVPSSKFCGVANDIFEILGRGEFIPTKMIPSIVDYFVVHDDWGSQSVEEWTNCDDIEDDDPSEKHEVGFGPIDAMAKELEGYTVVKSLLDISTTFKTDDNWKLRRRSVKGYGAAAKKSAVSREFYQPGSIMQKAFVEAAKSIQQLLSDTHPVVRDAACAALEKLATDSAPKLQEMCIETVVPSLIGMLCDPVPRVAGQAAATLDECIGHHKNEWSEATKGIRTAYSDRVMAALVNTVLIRHQQLLTDHKNIILTKLFHSISSLGAYDANLFVKSFDSMIGPVKRVLMGNNQCMNLIRVSFECASLMAMAVGKTHFSAHLEEVMGGLLGRIGSPLFNELLCIPSFYSDLGRVATTIGTDFARFLPSLMPHIKKAMDGSLAHDKNACGCERVNTKRAAISLNSELQAAIGEAFTPYTDQTAASIVVSVAAKAPDAASGSSLTPSE